MKIPWNPWPCWPGSENHWRYRFHIFLAYVSGLNFREYPQKICPEIWYVYIPPSIGSWTSHHLKKNSINEHVGIVCIFIWQIHRDYIYICNIHIYIYKSPLCWLMITVDFTIVLHDLYHTIGIICTWQTHEKWINRDNPTMTSTIFSRLAVGLYGGSVSSTGKRCWSTCGERRVSMVVFHRGEDVVKTWRFMWKNTGKTTWDTGENRGFHEVPSGNLTVCYWKWLFIVDFPIKMVIFHSYVSLTEGNWDSKAGNWGNRHERIEVYGAFMMKDWIPNRQNDVESDWLGKHRKQMGDKIDFHCSKIS